MDDTVWPVYHPARGEEGRETGRMEQRTSQREMGEPCQQPSLPRTPKKPLLPTLLSPPQEMWSQFRGLFPPQNYAVQPDPGEPGDHTCQASPCWDTGSSESPSHMVRLHPSGWPPLLPTTVCLNGGACDVADHLSSPPAPFYVVSFPVLRPPSSKLTERQVAGRFCCFGFPGSWAAGKVLEAEFPGDWDLGTGKHLYSLTRLILGGGNPVASLEGKIASKMGFVLHEPGAGRQEVEGMGPLRGILESLSHVLMPQGKWYTH